MKNLVIILVIVVLVVLLYNVFKKKSDNKPPVVDDKSNQVIGTNVTNYAGINVPTTATPPISNTGNKYVYVLAKYTTGIKVFTSPTLTSYINLKGGDYVGELKETKIIGGYEFYVTTSGRYVHKMFSELKGLR